ncbi:Ohr family peroxiredoxin [Polaromonas naphthalenivorans]|uniref:OsmC family protein n=1 Tax=Polaromonas naphthalenivorans (strain CJ2) TaxID=365044 RepID=A1VPT2_POLNA|nr:Ohr family peroxiredoxin [Polaromonas naphthalenivorans]ABM37660.1 OsmC family protein [Polaromonas naphthalenivorans CJ2]
MDLVYTTTMLTQGGRSGQIQNEDGSFKLKLAVPKEMKGSGDGTNPEQLFAGAFAACFEHSIRHIAKTDKLPLRGCYVEAVLSMYVNFEGAYRMALTLTAFMAGPLDQSTADSLMERAKGICPYADATKTNMTLNLKAVLDTPEAA